jgi:hypothetical protein
MTLGPWLGLKRRSRFPYSSVKLSRRRSRRPRPPVLWVSIERIDFVGSDAQDDIVGPVDRQKFHTLGYFGYILATLGNHSRLRTRHTRRDSIIPLLRR